MNKSEGESDLETKLEWKYFSTFHEIESESHY
jgi:hypothetical protein